jgi:glycosyltransferase involved in cell wall biosynthesis
MRVLIASDTYYPHVNGASYFTQRLAHILAEAGHEVGVISPSQTIGHDDTMHGKVKHFGIRSFPIFIVPKFRFVVPGTFSARVADVLRSFNPDVVHVQMHFAISRTTVKLAHKQDIPLVATNHFMPENLTHYLHLPPSVTRKIHELAWKDAVRDYRKTYHVTAPTKTAAVMLEPWHKSQVSVISNGIDRKRFNPNNDPTAAREKYALPQKPILLFVGRLDKEKNVDVVLRAVALARHKVDFHFVAAGHGAERARLERLAKQLGIEESVTFAGFVPDDLLPSLYAAADCFVNAGIAELQCIVAMEAMATGLPVLGAHAVALPELIHHGENGYLFMPSDHTTLATYIVTMLSSPHERARMGQKSLEIISNHDISNTLEAFEHLYRKAIAKQIDTLTTR